MTMMWPLMTEDKGLDVSARLTEGTGFVHAAARDGVCWRRNWSVTCGNPCYGWVTISKRCIFALTGNGDCGEALTLANG